MQNSHSSIYKKDILFGMLGLFLILTFIFLTNPQKLPAIFFLLLPTLIAFTSFQFIKLTFEVFTFMSQQKIKVLSGVIATAPTLIFILGSVGQLGYQDMVLALLLASGLGWYVKRQGMLYS